MRHRPQRYRDSEDNARVRSISDVYSAIVKTLLIMRHAKSSWKDPTLEDHERPLNRRGQRDAPRMGRLIKKKGLVPELVLSSTAVRARTTARLVAEACGYEGPVTRLDDLYLSDARAILEILQQLPDESSRVMLVGHNPDLEDLVLELSGEDETIVTAALAVLQLPVTSWAELRAGLTGKLVELFRPKELPPG
ncbi:MAG: histidine phosphatase family protein [Acidobacteriota bacterium]|nr:histidine phosphatase family protein [Acidobacteriota bacterium]